MKKVEVVLYDPLRQDKADIYNLCPKGIETPNGFSLQGGQRKFITLLSDNALTIAIGPLLYNNYYYHKDILISSRKDYSQFVISGGGQIDFVLMAGNPLWLAKFSGSSGDFGVFNKTVFDIEVAQAIAEAMKMNVSFETQLTQSARFRP